MYPTINKVSKKKKKKNHFEYLYATKLLIKTTNRGVCNLFCQEYGVYGFSECITKLLVELLDGGLLDSCVDKL